MIKRDSPMAANIPMRDLIKLESSLFTLTKKCMKTCKNFLDHNYQFKQDERYYSNLKSQKNMVTALNTCLQKCTADYATLNKHVRVRFMEDMDKALEKNQEIYDSFYKS